jgi:carbon-monoxide dehydrogenase medium subunit
VGEAVKLLQEKGDSAKVLAGGTDLLVQLRGGRYQIERLVDVKNIAKLAEIAFNTENGLSLGASVPCYQLYSNKAISSVYPGLIDSATLVGGIQIQGRASIGGNLCNAAPSGDAIPSLIVHGAICDIAGPDGIRSIPVETFCTAPGKTVLQSDELLISLRLPTPERNFCSSYLRFIPRNEMDIAVVGVGASVVLDSTKKIILSSRISLASVGPTPLFIQSATEALNGKEISEDSISTAAKISMDSIQPITDMRGPAEFRKHLVGVLTKRALERAIVRAKEGE